MTLDAMHLVLYAIYTEYQKELPDMGSVTAEALGVDDAVFNVAVAKLANEGLITGALLRYVDQVNYPVFVDMGRVMPTPEALKLAAGEMEISARTGAERTRQLLKRFAGYSWDALADMAARVLAEIGREAVK